MRLKTENPFLFKDCPKLDWYPDLDDINAAMRYFLYNYMEDNSYASRIHTKERPIK